MNQPSKTISSYAGRMDLTGFMKPDGTVDIDKAMPAYVEPLKEELRLYLKSASEALAGPLETLLDIQNALGSAFANLVVAQGISHLSSRDFYDRPEIKAWHAQTIR